MSRAAATVQAARIVGSILLAGGLALASCSGEEPVAGSGRPVILISIDSLRADHCTPYGYTPQFAPDQDTSPFLARMAEEGVLFEEASAACSWTLPSHISIFTGMSLQEHQVITRGQRLPDDTMHIADEFQRAGYQTGGFFSAPFLHPSWGFGTGFDTYVGAAPYLSALETTRAITQPTPGGMQAVHEQADTDKELSEKVIDAALAWLAEDDRYEQPFFLFLHLWDPHYDYEPPAEYAEQFHPGYEGTVTGKGFYLPDTFYEGDDLAHILALYDAEIRYTDDQMARLFSQLEEWGIGDEVILAVTSDHGDEFWEHGQKGHHKTLYEEVTHVPMVIRAPGLAPSGRRVAGTVSHYDLAPTLLDLSELPVWENRSGRSLRAMWEEQRGGHEVFLHLTHPGRRVYLDGWRSGDDKLLYRYKKPHTLTHYDLAADPGENSPTRFPSFGANALTQRVKSDFDQVFARQRDAASMTETGAMTELLGELGYADSEPDLQEQSGSGN